MTEHLAQGVLNSVIFSLLGVLIFGITFFVIVKLLPFSVRKEIEEDQNISLGIILGSVIIGLSLIISTAIR
ncbi:MAG: DUF350 domain-containing protein [Myxococcales bacterium]|jgi:putative membrane protein